MVSCRSRSRYLVGVLLALAGAGRAGAQLAASSPFVPVQNANTAEPTANAPLEFRALADAGDGMKFRLVDMGPKKNGTWVRLNERDPDFGVLAKQYDAGSEILTVEYQGRTLTLPLHEAKVTSGGVATQNLQAVNPQPAIGAGVVMAPPNPAPGSQTQLEAIAADVARRRALREQAVQQIGVVAPQVPPRPQPAPGQNPNDPRSGRNRGAQAP